VIQRVQQACDTLVEDATRGHRPPVSCRAGCAHCCRQPVFITPLEGVAIREVVEAKGMARKVEARIRRYLGEIRARKNGMTGLKALWSNVRGLGPAPSPSLRRAVYGPDCPFLENDRCTIYAVRPLMCREHISFDDPRKCERDEPFLGLDKPRFSEVSAWLSRRDVPAEDQMLPVFEYERAAEVAESVPRVTGRELARVLRWKTGR
jgi:Fe-S-cluster containining protein